MEVEFCDCVLRKGVLLLRTYWIQYCTYIGTYTPGDYRWRWITAARDPMCVVRGKSCVVREGEVEFVVRGGKSSF